MTAGSRGSASAHWTSGAGRRVVFDVETNGLLDELSTVHCLVLVDIDTGDLCDFDPTSIEQGLRILSETDTAIGHNVIDFDIRAIRKVYPAWTEPKEVLDTLILCKLLWPAETLIGRDMRLFNAGILPAKYIKRQSLGAWGYRLGDLKDEYEGEWDEWSETMQSYMRQDGRSNLTLWKRIEYRLGWTEQARTEGAYEWPRLPVEIEHKVARLLADQEAVGWTVDLEKATSLSASLKQTQHELGEKLKGIFGKWWAPVGTGKPVYPRRDRAVKCPEYPDITLPRFSETTGKRLKDYVGPPLEHYSTDAPYTRVEYTTFNPASRQHLADRLQRVFGWVPDSFTEKGQPEVSESAIEALPASVIDADTKETILSYFVVSKTLAQLATGKKSWLDAIRPDGRIHHRCDALGTITTRGAHFNPNLGQVPSVEVDEVKDASGKVVSKAPIKGLKGGFGWECRDLFIPQRGWEQTGTDASSLELIDMGHYLHPLDGGAFSERVCDPARDPHQEHGELTGLGRKPTKTATYAYVYGAGDLKLGNTVGFTDEEMPELLASRSLAGKLRWQRRIKGDDYKEPTEREKAAIAKGAFVKKRFEQAITGLKDLKEGVVKRAEQVGWLKGLDGRKLVVRKPHAALNTLLQGAGAICCKMWMIVLHEKLRAAGLEPRRDYNQLGWIHDELQIEHRPGLGPIIARLSNEAIREAGERLGLRGQLRSDAKTGASWAWTH